MPGRLICVAAAVVAGATWVSSQAQVPQFRAGVELTRLEVRVLDKAGNPVKDLTAADFAVREDGVAQEIALFETVSAEGASAAPRTFLFVLGRGHLEAPTKALQALIDFVRSKCLPADRVGVVAYSRVIELTTDHEAVARFLERFRASHVAIEGKIVRDFRAPAQAVVPDTEAAIDAVFQEVGVPVRQLAGGVNNIHLLSDGGKLRRALDYLSSIAGEKHVVLVTERAFVNVHNADKPSENYWIRWAAGARASLHFVHAGGVMGPVQFRRSSRIQEPLGFPPGMIDDQAWMAAQTGGTATFFNLADRPLAALDRATRLHYVLGYYPSRPVEPDQYRQIEVTVGRGDVASQYRHGYQARPLADNSDDYRRTVTEARLDDGLFRPVPTRANMQAPPTLSFEVLRDAGSTTPGTLKVAVSVDPRWIYFREEGSGYATDLDFRLLAEDAQRNVVGEHVQRLPLVLTADELGRLRRRFRPQGFTFDVAIEVKTQPAYLRGALYQFETDRVISGQLRLPR